MPRTSRIFFWAFLFLGQASTWADRVQYEFRFDALWNDQDHPGFPDRGHFSGVYGVLHNEDYQMWAPGQLASAGIQQIAELGTSTKAKEEVAPLLQNGTIAREIGASGGALSPYSVSSTFSVFPSHPLVSAVTMIAPSPDWFVGIHDVSLLDERGNWIPQVSLELFPYDAGTDSGEDFRAADEVTDPAVPIFRIMEDPLPAEFPPLGTLTLTLLSLPGDVNGSGEVGIDDLETMCYRLGRDLPQIDQAGNPNLIELEDVHALADRVLGTRPGDTNLDGMVDFGDFLTLAGNFGGSANWGGGDFDCNFQVEFADFLTLSQNFDSAGQSADTVSVPEPSSWWMALGMLALVDWGSKRNAARHRFHAAGSRKTG